MWKQYDRNNRFVFDLMKEDDDFNDRDYVYKKIASKNRIIQTSLQSIGVKMKLPFSLTFHLARHCISSFSLKINDLQNLILRQVTI